MLIITDISGNTEALTGYKGLKRFRNVSGEKTLAFLLQPTEQNAHSFNLVQEESIVEFKGEEYRIKQVSEKNKGKTFYKEVVAIHTFFDLIDDHIYTLHTGSMTFQAFLQFVFAGTPYTWDIIDTFYAKDWEKFGDDNRIALYQAGIKRYGAEFTRSGTHLTFKQKIGNATDFQFRYSYNIKTLTRDVNTNNLSTYIKGYGKQNEDGTYVIQSEYTSPNADLFGIRHAKPVRDERYTTLDGLNERLVAELIDKPELSITIDFVDLRRAGYPYDVPNEGDDVFLIYEPMGLDLETRIMDITEEFTEFNDYPIKTDVTLANYRNNMTDKLVEFSRTQKDINGILEGTRKLPYSVLDDAVKRATEAMQSAQTELEFNNGIIARSKDNPNHLVLFNSAGVAVSVDGGFTFRTAMTADGFVADLITVGTMLFDRLRGGSLSLGGLLNEHGELVILKENGEDALANFNFNGGYIEKLAVDNFINDQVAYQQKVALNFYVDPINGNDSNDGRSWTTPKKTIQPILDSLPKIINAQVSIYVHYSNGRNVNEKIKITGFSGSGGLLLDFQTTDNKINGNLLIKNCSLPIDVQNLSINCNENEHNAVLKIDRCIDVYVANTVLYGNDIVYAAILIECGSGARLSGVRGWKSSDVIRAAYNSKVFLTGCDGLGTAGLVAVDGAIITGHGNAPAGTTFNSYTARGGKILDTFTHPSAPTPPTPPPPPDTTVEFTNEGYHCYNVSYGYWNADAREPRQASWGYGRQSGFWFFGNQLDVLVGKNIKGMSVYVERKSGGVNNPAPVQVRWHGHKTQPSSPSPATQSSQYSEISLSVGGNGWVNVPSSFYNNFSSGAAKGIGVYISNDLKEDYAVMTGTCKVKVTYA
ncbi:phage tail protein [Bacillus sp. MRMR6]|uniref:phage tail protein n=1 Tax=Bacillus sp. MRMR6 TaxID=1928617 RepID=UPI00095241E8|nr:phage tail protein [Bacillus sp. MRMR6]OLS39149.1 hypothetical protein BTR25_13540 [Bacillus sp. MRMR6]